MLEAPDVPYRKDTLSVDPSSLDMPISLML
jgi:hypothetical protein